MLLYFIRHGQTDWNKDMRMQGQSDIPLNENGRESAIEAGKTLANTHIDLAFSSPLKRAKETAELVLAGRDIPIIEDKRIEEICFGICEGMKGRDENGQPVGCFAEFFAHPEQYQAPENGEDAKMLCARTWNFLKEVPCTRAEHFRILTVFWCLILLWMCKELSKASNRLPIFISSFHAFTNAKTNFFNSFILDNRNISSCQYKLCRFLCTL